MQSVWTDRHQACPKSAKISDILEENTRNYLEISASAPLLSIQLTYCQYNGGSKEILRPDIDI